MFKIVQLKFQNLQLSFQNFTTPIAKFTTECSNFCLGGAAPPHTPPSSRPWANPLFSVQYKFRHHSLTLTDQIRLESFNFSISATLVEFVLV